jgi:hypothetical protein
MIFSRPLKGCHTGVLRGRDVVGLAERGDWWPHEEEFHVTLVTITDTDEWLT